MRLYARQLTAVYLTISVIAMTRLKVPVLPSIVTAALLTTIISGGNAVSSYRRHSASPLRHRAYSYTFISTPSTLQGRFTPLLSTVLL